MIKIPRKKKKKFKNWLKSIRNISIASSSTKNEALKDLYSLFKNEHKCETIFSIK